MTISNDDLKAQLQQIHDLALSTYPLEDDDKTLDRRLLMALGKIGGIASRALEVEPPVEPSGRDINDLLISIIPVLLGDLDRARAAPSETERRIIRRLRDDILRALGAPL